MKSGIVCLYGQPNAGKSSLINRILGYKFLPISEKPQTTRDVVRAIYNEDDYQIVFLDTPGVFKPKKKFGSILLRNAENAKLGTDLIVYIVDLSTHINLDVTFKLKNSEVPVLIIFNKIDLISLDEGQKKIKLVRDILPDYDYVEISCLKDININLVLNKIKSYLTLDYLLYDKEIVSDRPKEFVIGEIIREKCLRLLNKEIPHTIYVDVSPIKESEQQMEIYADIIIEKESEKAIIIGKNGNMIKEISRLAETSIYGYFKKKIYCDLKVKVVKNWRSSEKYLKKFGFLDA